MKLSIHFIKNRLLLLVSLMILMSGLSATDIDLSGRFESDMKKDSYRKPAEMINLVGVKKGDRVLDFLGGGGYYSEILSRVVGNDGEVVLQIPHAYLKYVDKELKKRLADNRLKNVTYLQSEADDLKLGENVFDSAFLVLGYHDTFHTNGDWDFNADLVMPQLLKALKPGAKLLVIDHNGAKGTGATLTNKVHRIEDTFVKKDLIKKGFRFVKEVDTLRNKNDDLTKSVFRPEIRGKTDRFVMLFEKAAQ